MSQDHTRLPPTRGEGQGPLTPVATPLTLRQYASLGMSCEGNGLAGYGPDGQMWFQAPDDIIADCAKEPFWPLVAAVRAFLADEDAMMESLLAEGKRLEDFGFPFPRMVEIRRALATIEGVAAHPPGGNSHEG